MNPLRGIALKLVSVVLFVTMASLIKAASDVVPSGQAVFFRAFFALPVILGWVTLRGDLRTGLKVAKPSAHVVRGAVGSAAMICGFTALSLLPLPEVTALGYVAPLFTVILAAILLGERVRIFRISMVLIGLAGVIVILSPRLSLLRDGALETAALWGIGFVMASAFLRALAHVQIRRMTATEQTSAIVFWFSLTATGLSLFTVPFGWVLPPAEVAFMLVLAGIIGGVAQITMTTAYRFGTASMLAPFDYASILIASVVGMMIFDEVPTRELIVGSVIVTAAGIAIVLRERQLGLRRGKARSGLTPQG